jgi:tetratricopeptide (TPR) repeat protein
MYGQTFNAYLKAAEEAVQKKNYYAAYQYLQEAYEFDTTRLDLAFGSAEMARMYDAYNVAEELYQNVVDRDPDNAFPTAVYFLGEMQQRQGKYDAAITNFDMYLSENETDGDYFTEKARKERSASIFAKEQMAEPDLSVEVTRLGAVNTQFSEVGALEKDGKLFYSSLRFIEPNPANIREPRYLAKILVSEDNEAGVEEEQINDSMRITSHTSFSSKSNKIFYTLCDYNESNAIKCDLYYRDVRGNGSYGSAVRLPDYINDAVYTSTQPAIGIDPETNKEILYFVSDRPGGKGKYDIWYTIIDDNMNMTQPMNLDSINTIENDATPFFHNPSNTLYFSSQGYQGLGGYDIFMSEKNGGEYSDVQHLQNPVNSSYDDLYYTISNDMLTGHFSSNRESSTYIEDAIEACCFDIYHAKYEPVNLDLNALTCEDVAGNQRKLLGATVCLVDAKTGEVIDSVTNATGDNHNFALERNKEYLIIAKKEHYVSDTVSLSTKRVYKSKTFTKKICLLAKTLMLDVFTFDKVTLLELDGATVELKDVTDGSIQVVEKFNATGNDFEFTIKEAHNYEITANRQNYNTEIVLVNWEDLQVADGRARQDVFLTFGLLSKPLALYFDNDRPNMKSVATETNRDYKTTFDNYYKRKDLFVRRSEDSNGIEEFFENDLKGGYDTLQIFLALVQDILEKGEALELTVKGFTSPLATSAYNLYLGQRRVSSVKNELRKFNDGALIPYLDAEKLIITDISFGEALAPEGVSDSRNNQKLSIYSLEASRERRVEIIGVNQILR